MSGAFRFTADELGGPAEQLNAALEAARALEQAAQDVPATTVADTPFADRVMAAVADEPTPIPGGFLLPLRRHGDVRGFVESLRQAWVTTGRGRPAFARAMALAYVLVVATAGVTLAGAATFGAAGALGILGPAAPSTEPTASPEIRQLLPEATEHSSVEPSEEPEATEAPEASPDESEGPDRGGGGEPKATDDHHDNSGPGGGGDDDRSGPSSTEEPDASDDHSGSGSDDGSGSGVTDSGSDGASGSGGD